MNTNNKSSLYAQSAIVALLDSNLPLAVKIMSEMVDKNEDMPIIDKFISENKDIVSGSKAQILKERICEREDNSIPSVIESQIYNRNFMVLIKEISLISDLNRINSESLVYEILNNNAEKAIYYAKKILNSAKELDEKTGLFTAEVALLISWAKEESNNTEITGHWQLCGSLYKDLGKIVVDEDLASNESIESLLKSKLESNKNEIKSDSGLSLYIGKDLIFKEIKSYNPKVFPIGINGFSDDNNPVFDGKVRAYSSGFFIEPHNIEEILDIENQFEFDVHIRYNNDNTIISENIYIECDKLYRIINRVTDRLYADKTILVYER